MHYFARRKGKVFGPYTEDQINGGIKTGKIISGDLFSTTANGPWKSLVEVKAYLKKGSLDQLFSFTKHIPYKTNRGVFSKSIRVKYECPGCQTKLTNSLSEAGNNDSCPECHTAFVVPGIKEKNQHQKQLEENRNIAEREEPINPEVTSNDYGSKSIYGFKKRGHINSERLIMPAVPTELPRSSEKDVVTGCIWLFGAFLLVLFVTFVGIPIASGISSMTEDVGVKIGLADVAVFLMYAGIAIGTLFITLPLALIAMPPVWIIIILLMDNTAATRNPDEPSIFDKGFTWLFVTSLIGGPICFCLGLVLYFIAWVLGSEPNFFWQP